jgi:RimJ/RimL family protein N-acetyltransferase
MSLPTPTLHTARLLLRPFTQADADALFALHSNARVLRYWDAPPWRERARADRFIAACRQMEQEGTGARLAIERAADGVFIGWCGLVNWNPDYRSAKMGYRLDDAAWGQGFAPKPRAPCCSGPSTRWTSTVFSLRPTRATRHRAAC